MRIQVNVYDEAGKSAPRALGARTLCQKIIRRLVEEPELRALRKKREITLGVRLASLRASRTLNRVYRRRASAANVLSFPAYPTLRALAHAREASLDLGDIVLTPRVIRKEARLQKNNFYAQFFWMLAHGILHLMGFKHERGGKEASRMQALEDMLLSQSA